MDITMLRHFRFWLTMDHAKRVREYGWRPHLRYIFNLNRDRVVVNLQRNLTDLPPVAVTAGFEFRQADLDNPLDRDHWVHLVNTAYPDATEDDASALRLADHHPFMKEVETFFLYDQARPVATVSVGLFRRDPTFGGDARIAVDPECQGRGLGQTVILFALHRMRDRGCTHAEAVITALRETSLRLHFKLGFRLQRDRRKWNHDVQRRLWPARTIVLHQVKVLESKVLSNRKTEHQ